MDVSMTKYVWQWARLRGEWHIKPERGSPSRWIFEQSRLKTPDDFRYYAFAKSPGGYNEYDVMLYYEPLW